MGILNSLQLSQVDGGGELMSGSGVGDGMAQVERLHVPGGVG